MAAKTFVVQQTNAQGQLAEIEVTAERAETEGNGSTRVTFFDASDSPVASFINTIGWYEKA